jgi:hypothetical protein
MKRHAVLFIVLTVLPCIAPAQVVYDNTAAAPEGADPIQAFGPLYDSFNSGPGGLLSDVQILISGDGTSSGAFSLDLFADNLTSPGALVGNIALVPDASLTTDPSLADFVTTTLGISLPADTRYWIGLSVFGSSGTTAAWSWSSDTSGPGVDSEFVANVTGVYANDSFAPYQMSVTMTTPEPASLSLLMAALILSAGCWAKTRARTQ